MSILQKVTTGRRGRAQKVVVYAPEGFGKSTLASRFPKPLFADVEESTDQLNVARLTRRDLPTLKEFESALSEIAKERPCQTLVVDTIDWLEEMAVVEICAEHKCGNIEEVGGGFGKGYNYLTNRISVTLAKLDTVIASGIHVVLLAHSSIVRFDPPDGAGAFDRYELKLYKDRKGGKGTASLIKEWADMLLFGNWRTQIAEKGKGDNVKFKGVGGRERLMHCNRTAAWDAKNRHGMGDVEKWDIDPIKEGFLSVGAPWGEEISQPEKGGSSHVVPTETPKPSESVTSPVAADDSDEIPGIINPPAKEEPPVDDDLARICEPHADAINEYLRSNKRVAPTQTWRDVPADFAARVKKNPAGFLKVVGVGNGKVVAA